MITRKWRMDDSGWIGQSMTDMQDLNFSVFTETAQNHNQKLNDTKEQK